MKTLFCIFIPLVLIVGTGGVMAYFADILELYHREYQHLIKWLELMGVLFPFVLTFLVVFVLSTNDEEDAPKEELE